VAASYGKLSAQHEEACWELKKAGKTGREIREVLARGGYKIIGTDEGLSPASISASRANRIARRLMDERDDLYTSEVLKRPTNEGARLLVRRLLRVAECETNRLERQQRAGRLDAAKLGRLAGAVERLVKVSERMDAEPPDDGATDGKADSQPDSGGAPSFAASLLGEDDGETVPETPSAPASPPPGSAAPLPLADRVVPAGSHSAPLVAVPPDHPPSQ
jgi:hypothetical protein